MPDWLLAIVVALVFYFVGFISGAVEAATEPRSKVPPPRPEGAPYPPRPQR